MKALLQITAICEPRTKEKIVKSHFKHLITAIPALLAIAAATNSHAVPMIFEGTDMGNSNTTNSDAAFLAWQGAVSNNFVLDDFDSPTGSTGFGGSLTTSLGNTFTTSDDLMGNSTFGVGVISGSNLQLTKQGPEVDFIWSLASPVDAFGFHARNNSGGTVTINFDDGAAQSFSLIAQDAGNGDNLFWGVTNLANSITSVSITSTDPRQNSNWDRFVYRTATVSEPGIPGLMLAGLAGLLFLRRATAA